MTLTGRREEPLRETATLVEEAGAGDRSEMAESSRENPREMDEQISSIKGDLEAAVQGHRSI